MEKGIGGEDADEGRTKQSKAKGLSGMWEDKTDKG